MYPNEFRSGMVLSATASSVTTEFAKRMPSNLLRGRVVQVVEGTGSGQSAGITANAVGTGQIDVAPSFSVTPDTTSRVEVWPEEIEPERVNDALNAAVLEASTIVGVREDLAGPTLDSARSVVTVPPTWTHVQDLQFREDGGWWRQYVRAPYDDYLLPGEYQYTILGGSLYLSYPIPANLAGSAILLRGYRLPAELVSDSTLSEVHPDFVVYTAALNLDSGLTEGPALDPEAHGSRAAAWLRASLVARSKLATDWGPNAHRVRP